MTVPFKRKIIPFLDELSLESKKLQSVNTINKINDKIFGHNTDWIGFSDTIKQIYPEKNSFSSYFFLCDLDGHIDDSKVKKSLEELGLHCEDFHVLGVFPSDKFRDK